MKKTFLVPLLCLVAIALAADTPPEGLYDGVFTNTVPQTAFVFAAFDGPPRYLVTDTATFNYNPETGCYVGPGGDTWFFSGGIAHFTHILPFPAVGPFPSKDGPYWISPK